MRWLLALALALCTGCGGGDDGGGGGGSEEPSALRGITDAHNQVRATVDVPALTWDPELAAVAQAWAEGCVDSDDPVGLIDHNPGRSDNYPGYVGENTFGHTNNATPSDAVDAWAGEVADYSYDSNSCAAGRICGHYTQIVWRDTERLGCGIASCTGLQFGSTIVCNYSPGGNIMGQRPY